MYLKRLEIMGFKSFADRIRLDFLPGVTGVVGPNGSGKSNISDALRWVLGEQSVKNLRGAKMDDVIFAGTELRKALGLAEVTIVLDNSQKTIPVDFTEIAVTRKLFRSGESEFYINKSPVRLKDIQELFYDTGLGKEAYSVIGQGKIDAILSVKAEERRSIFEEAAGIIKYKSRKQVAGRKLEDTNHSLLRLKDILNELQNQLGPLESQAALAEQYLRLKESLTYLEINYYGSLVGSLETKTAALNQAKDELLQRFQDFERQENVLESELEENRLALLNQDQQLMVLNEDYFKIKNQIEKYREQSGFLSDKLESLAKQAADLTATRTENTKRRESFGQEEAALITEIEQVSDKVTELERNLAASAGALKGQDEELFNLESHEQELKNEVIEFLNAVATLKNKVNSVGLQKDYLQKQIVEQQRKQELFTRQIGEQETAEQHRKNAFAEAQSEIESTLRQQAELTILIRNLEGQAATTDAKNLECKEKIRGLESKIGLLEEMERSFQGYFQGVKALMAETAAEPFHRQIRGIVADLITVRPGLELALETALGSSLQNVVIETDQSAQEAIAYLKKHGKGRATFLPLNLIRANEHRSGAVQQLLGEFSCQTAVSILEFAPEYRPLLLHLLGQTIVAPDLRTAVKISAKLDKGYRIVTPEGDLVNPGGSITGGSIDKRRLGLLSRRREIEDLKNEKQEALASFEEGLHAFHALKEQIQAHRLQYDKLKTLENETKIKKASLERELQNIALMLAQARQEFSLGQAQLAELSNEGSRFDVGQDELAQQCAAQEETLRASEADLAALTAEIRRKKADRDGVQEQLAQVKSLLSAAYQEKNGKYALKDRLLKQLREVESAFTDLARKEQEIELEKLRIEETRLEIAAGTAAAEARLGTQEADLNAARFQKDQIQVKIKELENKERSFRRKSNDFQNQIHQYDLAISQQMAENDNIRLNLTDNYGADWWDKRDPAWTDGGDTKQRVEVLKGDIRELGPVNVAAIEDYAQLRQRSDFLITQMDDLEKAREALLKVITEIERTITKRFVETFAVVRANFRRIFAELFEGGNADLLLIDAEHPLESGIEVIAQPPGKKLQSLSLLSGGERAMTAIALLFAILQYKPSPFCVLDEIDATLDEVNVHRFSKLMELFSRDMQFIVVTHRRGTMEAANALYGVTMEELGVSKLISLDLTEKAG